MKERQITVAVLIDALGWEYIKGADFLSDLLPHRKPLRTILGFSSGAIPTILTGVTPAQHGHWNLLYYDPERSPFRWLRGLSFVPDAMLDTRVGRKIFKELGRRVLSVGPGFECCVSPHLMPYFSWVEKRNIYEEGGITSSASIFDRLREAAVPYRAYSYHDYSDAEVLRLAVHDVRSTDARFFFLYLSEMDSFLHMNCADQAGIDRKLSWYDNGLRRVFDAALEIDPMASLAVFSDHGMAPVSHSHDLAKDVEALGFTLPEDYLSVYDSTMARFWFFSERARDGIAECLRSSPCGRIVPDDELQRLGVCFADRRFGELIFLLHPGWILARSDFNGPQWMPVGMHGYHPDDAHSDAIFLSNRQPVGPMRTIADVHDHMLGAVGL